MNKAFDKSKYALWINPADVKPYERNVKQHDEKQIRNIVNSIKRFGWQQDTVITSDNVLVIGHGRRLAALKIGCEMPYHVIDKTADELTDEDIRELRIADNQTNAETGFDFEMMAKEIEDLSFEGFDFDFNSSPDILADEFKGETNGGEIEENEKKPVAVKIVFDNAQSWRKYENDLREFVDTFDNVKISVGEYDESDKSDV